MGEIRVAKPKYVAKPKVVVQPKVPVTAKQIPNAPVPKVLFDTN